MLKFIPTVKKKSYQFLLLTGLWVILPLLVVEFLMIILEPYLFKGFFQYDPDIGFRVRPYTKGSNQFGFNDRDYPLDRTPETTRLLILGDSYGWVGGLLENYTAVLDNQLVHQFGENKIEVINAGYSMTHTGEQRKILEKYGMQYQPDLVILGFFAGNDFHDAQPDRKRIIVNDIYFDIHTQQELIIFGYPIIPQSRLLLLIQQKYKIFQKTRQNLFTSLTSPKSNNAEAEEEDPKNKPPLKYHWYSPGLPEATYLNIEMQMLDFYNIQNYESGKYQDRIQLIFENIAAIAELLKSNNTKFIVAIYPAAFQVDESLTQKIFQTGNLNPEDFDLFLAQKILKEYLDNQGIPYIDLLDEFRAEQKNQPLYLKNDTHWNKAGNQFAADILFENLVPVIEKIVKTPHP
ncbi:GDSL-type esterase/lipase family protein [Oscillatoria sp. HE19RPO]|uniref:alginate O-acetyltransferase AlgX-related protein n=1 Tax=Oscillatoria sp. HE19RPO TaxID=2954806 RepID=UPI0020C5688D|nr:GDSL-type esterase/lipase family protein [Oscillatoria sp. HE19RPO]